MGWGSGERGGHAPGEQAGAAPIRWPLVILLVLLFAVLALWLGAQSGNLREYRLYFTEDRKAATLDLRSLSEAWTERALRERFAGYPINCGIHRFRTSSWRACGVDLKSVNGVSALFVSFFFRAEGGALDQVAINIPWWAHEPAFVHLLRTLGPPMASQQHARAGVRLHGWQLADGSAVFFNRERPLNVFEWSAIQWRSASSCRDEACFAE